MAACLEAGETCEAAYGADDGAVGPKFFEVGVEADAGEGGEVGDKTVSSQQLHCETKCDRRG